MGRKVTLVLPGEPVGKGRPRAVPRIVWKDGEPEAIVSLITPPETRMAEHRLREAFKKAHPYHEPFSGPVLLRFTAVFETPRSFNKALREAAARGELYAMKKPDKDNIEKLIADALNHVCFHDDAQLMGGGIKRYGSPARIEMSFESLEVAHVPPTPGQRRAEKKQAGQLALPIPKPTATPKSAPTKSVSTTADLSDWNPKQRAMIEAAIARDEAAKLAKRGGAG